MTEEDEINKTPAPTVAEQSINADAAETMEYSPWLWVRFGIVAFFLMLFYIYNQHHANKALRKKELLIKELKELHSEKISLESEVTNASKQSELSKKLEPIGLKELTEPPIKIEYRKTKK